MDNNAKPYDFSHLNSDKPLDAKNIKFSDDLLNDAKPAIDKAAGHFVPAHEGHYKVGDHTTDFKTDLDGINKLKNNLQIAESAGSSESVLADHKSAIESAEGALTKKGEAALQHLNEGVGHQGAAIEKLAEVKKTQLEGLNAHFQAKIDAVTGVEGFNQKSVDAIKADQKVATEAFEKHFAEAEASITKNAKELPKLARNIENATGAKVADHAKDIKTSGYGVDAAKEVLSKSGSNLGALFKEGSTLSNKAGGLLGLGSAAAFTLSAGSDMFGEKEKDAAGQEMDRSFWKPVLKLGAAALATYMTVTHGGKVLAGRTV